MRRWICGLLCLLMLAGTCNAWAEFKKTKVAVSDFAVLSGSGPQAKEMGAIVAEWFTTALVKTGRFDVIERTLLKKILQEQKLEMTGLLDESTASKVGKLLGVKSIISGSVVMLPHTTEINARIIDVQTACIKDAESVSSASTSQLQDLVAEMAQRIIKKFPLEGYVVQRDGDHIDIDLGRSAGVHPGMQFIAYREGKVIKQPKTGAVLYVRRIETGRFKITAVRDNISEGILLEEKGNNAVVYGQPVYNIAEPRRVAARLYVSTEPSDARIRILNITASFEQGIRLAPGRYQLEVSADGYRNETHWIELEPGADKKVSIHLVALEQAPPPLPPPEESSIREESPPQSEHLTPQVSRFIHMLRSGNDEQIRLAAREAERHHPHAPRLLETANEVLLDGYLKKVNDKRHVDAMAWLCKYLGNSQDTRYLSTLKTVSDGNVQRKLKSYARRSYERLSRQPRAGRRR